MRWAWALLAWGMAGCGSFGSDPFNVTPRDEIFCSPHTFRIPGPGCTVPAVDFSND